MAKKMFFSFLALVIIFSGLSPTYASANSNKSVTKETFDYEGKNYEFTKTIDGSTIKTVVEEDGVAISEAEMNTISGKIVVDGVELGKNDKDLLRSIADQTLEESSPSEAGFSTMASCTMKHIGTKNGSFWVPKVGVAAIAAAISIAVPGLGASIAWSMASVVAGSTNTIYYRRYEYSCYSGGKYHLQQDWVFFSDSSRKKRIGNWTSKSSRR
ncbi:hypothetical protein ABEP71_19135 [Bacillus velezensis]